MSFQPGVYVDPADEYERIAEYCAKWQYWDPRLVQSLLAVSDEFIEQIEANPHLFEQRVHDYMYGMLNDSNFE